MSEEYSRQIVLDTETTGLSPEQGHRIIEIGCVELIDRRLSNKSFHIYLNPDRLIDEEAIKVHGITNEFLEDKPRFEDIVDDYIAFTEGAELIIHNAPFDVGFLNAELARIPGQTTVETISGIFDTLPYARKKHPGARATLDALCKRYGIDNSHRELHGALLDAEILADVYLAMTGGQFSIQAFETDQTTESQEVVQLSRDRAKIQVIQCSDEEFAIHQQRLDYIDGQSKGAIWKQECVKK